MGLSLKHTNKNAHRHTHTHNYKSGAGELRSHMTHCLNGKYTLKKVVFFFFLYVCVWNYLYKEDNQEIEVCYPPELLKQIFGHKIPNCVLKERKKKVYKNTRHLAKYFSIRQSCLFQNVKQIWKKQKNKADSSQYHSSSIQTLVW